MKLIDGQKNGVIYCSVIFPKFLNKTLKLQHPLIFRGFLFGHFVQLTLKNATSCGTTTAHITCFFETFLLFYDCIKRIKPLLFLGEFKL